MLRDACVKSRVQPSMSQQLSNIFSQLRVWQTVVISAKHHSSSPFLHNSSWFPSPWLSIVEPAANSKDSTAQEPWGCAGEFRSKQKVTEQTSHITAFQAGAPRASGFGGKVHTELH